MKIHMKIVVKNFLHSITVNKARISADNHELSTVFNKISCGKKCGKILNNPKTGGYC